MNKTLEKIETQIMKNRRYRLVEKMKKMPRRYYLMTIRYSNQTHAEMKNYCDENKTRSIKCIYGCPKIISDCVIRDSILFVLEMNNDKNRIEGIGMIRNTLQEPPIPIKGQYNAYRTFKIHDDGNLNRHVYIGSKRIDRSEMTEYEESVMAAFDIICFKGRNHQKRCHGITIFPLDVIEKCKKIIDLQTFAMMMFKNRI
jgi:hypothetical protein